MYIAISYFRRYNVIKKEEEKFLKYKKLTVEVQRAWNVKNESDVRINGTSETI